MKLKYKIVNIMVALAMLQGTATVAQGQVQMSRGEDIDIPFLKSPINNFQVLQENSLLLNLYDGIYMPYEKTWFYKLQATQVLKFFAISHVDTSMYMVIEQAGVEKVAHLSKDTQGNQVQRNIPLDMPGRKSIYPVAPKCFYMINTANGLSTVHYFDGTVMKKVFSSDKVIGRLVPLDKGSVIMMTGDRLVLLRANKPPVVIFQSDLPMFDIAVDSHGQLFISNAAGIFLLDKNFNIVWQEASANDARLMTLDNKLFALSNTKHKILVYEVAN